MDMKRKVEIAAQAVRSIADHSDADSVVLLAALEQVQANVAGSIALVRDRAAAEAREALGAGS